MNGSMKHYILHGEEWVEVLSQKEVADELNVTPPNISYYLKKETPFNTISDLNGVKWIVKDEAYDNWKNRKALDITQRGSRRKITIEKES